jgi:hypothetical protein
MMTKKNLSMLASDAVQLLKNRAPRAVIEATREEQHLVLSQSKETLKEEDQLILSLLDKDTQEWLLLRSVIDKTDIATALSSTLKKIAEAELPAIITRREEECKAAKYLIEEIEAGYLSEEDIGIPLELLKKVLEFKTPSELKKELELFQKLGKNS